MDEEELDINECIPMIDSIVEVLDLDTPDIDLEEILDYLEDIFVYTFDKKRMEVMELIKNRIIEFKEHVTRRVVNENVILRKRRMIINQLLEEDGLRKKPKIETNINFDGNTVIEVDPNLHDIVGDDNMTKNEFFERFWKYLDENKLFDPNNYDQIICDEKLSKLFGKTILKEDLERRLFQLITNIEDLDDLVSNKKFEEYFSESESESEYGTEDDIEEEYQSRNNGDSEDEHKLSFYTNRNVKVKNSFTTFRTDIIKESDSESEVGQSGEVDTDSGGDNTSDGGSETDKSNSIDDSIRENEKKTENEFAENDIKEVKDEPKQLKISTKPSTAGSDDGEDEEDDEEFLTAAEEEQQQQLSQNKQDSLDDTSSYYEDDSTSNEEQLL